MKNYKINSIRIALSAALVLGLIGPVAVMAASPATVSLGTAGNFVILTKTGISSTGATSVIGDIGVSPAASTYITGFDLTLPVAGAFATSAVVSGNVYAPGYANPTPANMTTAVSDMQTAYTDAMGRAADVTELGAGNIGGLTLVAGVYKWGTGLTIPTDVTLSGGANDVWIFQVAQNLNVSSAAKIVLAGGAQASNIFWVVAGQTTIGTTAVFNGNILGQTAIVLNTGARLNGRALAQTAVTLDSNAVTKAPSTGSGQATPTPTTTPTPSSSSDGGSSATTPSSSSSFSGAVVTSSPTATQSNQVRINELLVTLQSLKAQVLAKQQASQQGSASSFGQQVRAIAINMGEGGRGNDVVTLQQFLISQNKGSAAVALGSVGATAYFGPLTRSALAEFQTNVGINPALGNFGPITRAYIGAH